MSREDGGVGRRGHQQEEPEAVSYTHLRAHETVLDLVCRLLLEKKKQKKTYTTVPHTSGSRTSTTEQDSK